MQSHSSPSGPGLFHTLCEGDEMSEPRADDTIAVFGIDEPEEMERGLSSRRTSEFRYGRAEVQVSVLQARMSEFVGDIDSMVQSMPEPKSGFTLESITVAAEISAKGTVSLLGTGGEVA